MEGGSLRTDRSHLMLDRNRKQMEVRIETTRGQTVTETDTNRGRTVMPDKNLNIHEHRWEPTDRSDIMSD